MDEDLNDYLGQCFEDSEFDLDYEYNAAQFFDFTRPETYSEAEEAEDWFDTIGSYPPSPLIVKLMKWCKDTPRETTNASAHRENGEDVNISCNNSSVDMDSESSISDETNKGPNFDDDSMQSYVTDATKSLAKLSKPRSSTLMKPTASHLAKLNRTQGVHSNRFSGRSEKSQPKLGERRLQNVFGSESQASKRQKLDIGYLRKVAHLKHQALLLHKAPKKDGLVHGDSLHPRLKVTVPIEPDLETAHRAQRLRSKNNSELGEQAKVDRHTFKARPLNRKILKAPSLPLHKKSTPQLPQFQAFHFKTSERAMKHASANSVHECNSDSISQNGSVGSRRLNSEDDFKQEKCGAFHRFKSCPLNNKESEYLTDKRLLQNPPTELFSKLSLKPPEAQSNSLTHPKSPRLAKGLKENASGSFQQESRSSGKNNQCGGDFRIPEIGPLSNANRSMDIR